MYNRNGKCGLCKVEYNNFGNNPAPLQCDRVCNKCSFVVLLKRIARRKQSLDPRYDNPKDNKKVDIEWSRSYIHEMMNGTLDEPPLVLSDKGGLDITEADILKTYKKYYS